MLIIGLGNSGKEYEKTYHNAGFLFIDWLAKERNGMWKLNKKIPAEIAEIPLSIVNSQSSTVTLIKPVGYMNESGAATKRILKYLNIETFKNLVVAHDDSDIELGKYKIAFDRGSAGHNGVQSIIDALGTKKFYRVRIGVRKSEDLSNVKSRVSKVRAGAREFVLKNISASHKKILEEVFEKIEQDILGRV